MDITVSDPMSLLDRLARARSQSLGRRVEAIRLDSGPPTVFVADEIVVDAEDDGLIADFASLGGHVIREAEDPPMPEAFREAGMTPRQGLDLTLVPRTVRIRFDRVPDASTGAGAVLGRAEIPADRITYSSEAAAALVELIAPARAEGRGVYLNEVGEDHTLPLVAPLEGGSLAYPADPLTWASMVGASRIADAWQLVESFRLVRGGGAGPVFICICDSGFWSDAAAPPGSPGWQTRADIGSGILRWNAVTDRADVPPGPGRKNWHGTQVASAAAAVVGNTAGAAGSGGTVAMPCFFHDDRSAETAKRTMVRCAQWGIDIVNYSGSFTSVEFFFGTSDWNRTFNWAADAGVLMIASAGNDDLVLPDAAVLRPATRTPRALTVGALDANGGKASFSNSGSSVGLWAPGTSIPVVPTPTSAATLMGSRVDGTSLAAPLVAGVAAMMRFVNPTMTVDQIRDSLVGTGWDGAAPVTRGLDAYAAVWEAMAQRMAETSAETAPERLYPQADGTFRPIFNTGFNRRGDTDAFLLEVSAFSQVEFTLEWYDRLARVDMRLETLEEDLADDSAILVRGPATRRITLTAQVGSGTYRLWIRGSHPTAYLLRGQVLPGTLAPDRFEANDSFEQATRLRVVAGGRFELEPVWARTVHGPGFFDLTLHTAGAGPGTTDGDFFRVDVPAEVGALRLPQVMIGSDEKVDVVLFDASEREVHAKRGVREAVLGLTEGTTAYVRVSGATHTRYTLWVGANLDADKLRRSWQKELQIIPDWWEDPHPDWFRGLEELRGVVLDQHTLRDGLLSFGGAVTGVLPTGVHLDLLDDAGELVATGEAGKGRLQLDISSLQPGPYVLRVRTDEATHREVGAIGIVPVAPTL